jgi:hypothetical protein
VRIGAETRPDFRRVEESKTERRQALHGHDIREHQVCLLLKVGQSLREDLLSSLQLDCEGGSSRRFVCSLAHPVAGAEEGESECRSFPRTLLRPGYVQRGVNQTRG